MVVTGGPSQSASGQITTEAYDKVEIAVPAGSTPVVADIQPSGEGQVEAIMIISDFYSEDLSFTVDEGIVPIVLSKPLMIMGAALIASLLGSTQNAFTFTNADSTTAANVTILVARNAIEPET
jgi:hypothetical protein